MRIVISINRIRYTKSFSCPPWSSYSQLIPGSLREAILSSIRDTVRHSWEVVSSTIRDTVRHSSFDLAIIFTNPSKRASEVHFLFIFYTSLRFVDTISCFFFIKRNIIWILMTLIESLSSHSGDLLSRWFEIYVQEKRIVWHHHSFCNILVNILFFFWQPNTTKKVEWVHKHYQEWQLRLSSFVTINPPFSKWFKHQYCRGNIRVSASGSIPGSSFTPQKHKCGYLAKSGTNHFKNRS